MSVSKTRVRFKPYVQNQISLLPPSLDELIPQAHVVRVVDEIINKIDIDSLLAKYAGGGCSSYHPRMMLKVLVYSYLSNVYSSRKMEAAVRENIYFMWLAGMEQPDHNTLNRFRSDKLKGVIKEVFAQVVILMVESGHVDLQKAYTDGTKIEANANRYTFVWGKNVKNSRERIKNQLDELWKYTEEIAAEELKDNAPTSYEELKPEQVAKTIDEINTALKNKPVDKKIKQKLNYAKKNWPKNLEKYEQQEKDLGGRNNYSKTDPDATFMRMKEDHMGNGQLKPGYNLQISTQNQFITHYSLHQNPTDFKTLIPHLDEYEQIYTKLPNTITADAGYGSEENYEYLASKQMEAFVKYPLFHNEQHQKGKEKSVFHPDNLYYNKEKDHYICPMGQAMDLLMVKQDKSETGYKKTIHVYAAKNCNGCPLNGVCHKSKYNRRIEVNRRLNKLKAQAKELLLSDEGIFHRKKRPVEVEAVFGILKQNHGFRRFMLRGMEKVSIETGLMALAHNIRKHIKTNQKQLVLSLLNSLETLKSLLNDHPQNYLLAA